MPTTMICPNCGGEMNHHGDKLVHSESEAPGASDSLLGGMVFEFHSCPQCGASGSRPE